MYTYTVTIGRNVGDVPMSDLDWATFEDEVNEALVTVPYERQIAFLETHRGTGVWQGVAEESVKVTMALISALPEESEGCRDLLALRNKLFRLAGLYGQDAIALTIGQSELIPA